MEKIEILTILNDWNFWSKNLDVGIRRENYIKNVKDTAITKEVVIIKGIRRCGKSTILLQFCSDLLKSGVKKEDILIINFEDPRFRQLDLNLLNKIYEIYLTEMNPSKSHYVILDEVQVIDQWEKFARLLHENKKVNVFVTGSSSKLLDSEYATVLTGRHLDIRVHPLSFKEFLFFRNIHIKNNLDLINKRHEIQRNFNEYLKYGGFPKIILTNDENKKKELLQTYFQDIVVKDISSRHNIKEIKKVEELAKYFLTNISSICSLNKTKNILGLNLETAQRFSEYISESYLLSFVSKFSWKKKEQILNPKKVYSTDIGIRNAVSFLFKEDYGRIAENIVFNKLQENGGEVYYWKGKKECDFITKKGEKIEEIIQVSWDISNPDTKEREINGAIEACYELKKKKASILTADYEGNETIEGINITFIPIWKWLLE